MTTSTILAISITIIASASSIASAKKNKAVFILSIVAAILAVWMALESECKEKKNDEQQQSLRDTINLTVKTARDIKLSDSLYRIKIDTLLKGKNLRLQGDSILVPITVTSYKNSIHVESHKQSGGQTGFEINN